MLRTRSLVNTKATFLVISMWLCAQPVHSMYSPSDCVQMYTNSEGLEMKNLSIRTNEKITHMEYDQHTPGNILYSTWSSIYTLNRTSNVTTRIPIYSRFTSVSSFSQLNHTHLVVVDSSSHCLKMVSRRTRLAKPLAGHCRKSGYQDGNLAASKFNKPLQIAAINKHSLLVSDFYNRAIRQVNLRKNLVSTFADVYMHFPLELVLDQQKRNVFISTTDSLMVINISNKKVTHLKLSSNHRLGEVFNSPLDMSVLADNTLLIADTGNHLLKLVDVTTNRVKVFQPQLILPGKPTALLALRDCGGILWGDNYGNLYHMYITEGAHIPQAPSFFRKLLNPFYYFFSQTESSSNEIPPTSTQGSPTAFEAMKNKFGDTTTTTNGASITTTATLKQHTSGNSQRVSKLREHTIGRRSTTTSPPLDPSVTAIESPQSIATTSREEKAISTASLTTLKMTKPSTLEVLAPRYNESLHLSKTTSQEPPADEYNPVRNFFYAIYSKLFSGIENPANKTLTSVTQTGSTEFGTTTELPGNVSTAAGISSTTVMTPSAVNQTESTMNMNTVTSATALILESTVTSSTSTQYKESSKLSSTTPQTWAANITSSPISQTETRQSQIPDEQSITTTTSLDTTTTRSHDLSVATLRSSKTKPLSLTNATMSINTTTAVTDGFSVVTSTSKREYSSETTHTLEVSKLQGTSNTLPPRLTSATPQNLTTLLSLKLTNNMTKDLRYTKPFSKISEVPQNDISTPQMNLNATTFQYLPNTSSLTTEIGILQGENTVTSPITPTTATKSLLTSKPYSFRTTELKPSQNISATSSNNLATTSSHGEMVTAPVDIKATTTQSLSTASSPNAITTTQRYIPAATAQISTATSSQSLSITELPKLTTTSSHILKAEQILGQGQFQISTTRPSLPRVSMWKLLTTTPKVSSTALYGSQNVVQASTAQQVSSETTSAVLPTSTPQGEGATQPPTASLPSPTTIYQSIPAVSSTGLAIKDLTAQPTEFSTRSSLLPITTRPTADVQTSPTQIPTTRTLPIQTAPAETSPDHSPPTQTQTRSTETVTMRSTQTSSTSSPTSTSSLSSPETQLFQNLSNTTASAKEMVTAGEGMSTKLLKRASSAKSTVTHSAKTTSASMTTVSSTVERPTHNNLSAITSLSRIRINMTESTITSDSMTSPNNNKIATTFETLSITTDRQTDVRVTEFVPSTSSQLVTPVLQNNTEAVLDISVAKPTNHLQNTTNVSDVNTMISSTFLSTLPSTSTSAVSGVDIKNNNMEILDGTSAMTTHFETASLITTQLPISEVKENITKNGNQSDKDVNLEEISSPKARTSTLRAIILNLTLSQHNTIAYKSSQTTPSRRHGSESNQTLSFSSTTTPPTLHINPQPTYYNSSKIVSKKILVEQGKGNNATTENSLVTPGADRAMATLLNSRHALPITSPTYSPGKTKFRTSKAKIDPITDLTTSESSASDSQLTSSNYTTTAVTVMNDLNQSTTATHPKFTMSDTLPKFPSTGRVSSTSEITTRSSLSKLLVKVVTLEGHGTSSEQTPYPSSTAILTIADEETTSAYPSTTMSTHSSRTTAKISPKFSILTTVLTNRMTSPTTLSSRDNEVFDRTSLVTSKPNTISDYRTTTTTTTVRQVNISEKTTGNHIIETRTTEKPKGLDVTTLATASVVVLGLIIITVLVVVTVVCTRSSRTNCCKQVPPEMPDLEQARDLHTEGRPRKDTSPTVSERAEENIYAEIDYSAVVVKEEPYSIPIPSCAPPEPPPRKYQLPVPDST